MAVGGERGLGDGRHGVLPLRAACHDHGLKGQRVDVKPGQRLTLRPGTDGVAVLVALVQNTVNFPHLVEDGGYARVWVRQHGDVGAFEQAEEVGKLLFIHP